MQYPAALREQLARILDWEEAHLNLERAVDGIPPERRGETPAQLPYSCWRLLWHIWFTQQDILDFCLNPDYKEHNWPDDYWPPQGAPVGGTVERHAPRFPRGPEAPAGTGRGSGLRPARGDTARRRPDIPARDTAHGGRHCLPHGPDRGGPPVPGDLVRRLIPPLTSTSEARQGRECTMQITTTDSLDGHRVRKYLGIVTRRGYPRRQHLPGHPSPGFATSSGAGPRATRRNSARRRTSHSRK